MRVATLPLLAGLAAGCQSDRPTALPEGAAASADLAGLVTANVAAALIGGRLFDNGTPATKSPHRELSQDQAEALALIAGREHGPSIRDYLEEGHGSQINFAGLRVCGRSMYGRPAQPAADRADATGWRRNHTSAKWFVALCSEGQPQVSVAVAARATDLRIVGGHLAFPPDAGGEFFMKGIPRAWSGALPASAEEAVRLVARQYGRRVSSVPELVAPDPGWVPHAAQWRLTLSADLVAGVSSGALESSPPKEVFVGVGLESRSPAAMISLAAQPAASGPESDQAFRWTPATRFIPIGLRGGNPNVSR